MSSSGSSLWNTIMADTVGVIYRAGTGAVDPWTKAELTDQAANDYAEAGMDPDMAATQADSDITSTLKTFSLGNGDVVGADPSQANLNVPGLQSIKDALSNLNIPTWVYWAAGGTGVLVVLYILGPYVGLFERRT